MIWRARPVGLALIGCGVMGELHAQAIRANARARMRWCFDPQRSRADKVAEICPPARVADNLASIWNDSGVEGVLLATPHHLHLSQTRQALEAGKHVLVEKPMAMNFAEAEQMLSAAQQAQRRLLVGQVMRFWPNVQRARKEIAAGAIGQVKHVIRVRRVYQPDAGRAWAYDLAQSGGWLLHGNAVHEIDTLQYLLDSPIEQIDPVATRNNLRWGDVDELSAVLRFANGAIGCMSHSLNCHVQAVETSIIGERGSIQLSQWQSGYALDGTVFFVGQSDGLSEQLADFLRAVRGDGPSVIDAERIMPTMETLERLRKRVEPGGGS